MEENEQFHSNKEEAIIITENQILNCSLNAWYPQFKRLTFKSKVIPLEDNFVKWLHEDGIVIDDHYLSRPDHYDRFDVGEEEWSSEEDEEEIEENALSDVPHFPELEKQIREAIDEFDGEIFPKLNWSSPKDATWMMTSGNLKCTRPEDVFLLLKSSDFVSHDLGHAFEMCSPPSSIEKPDQFFLVLRKWYDLKPLMEFRCFVKNNQLIGVSQRDYTNFYSYLVEAKSELKEKITEFFDCNIRGKFPDPDFVFDVYINNKMKVYLVDFNPYGEMTDPLLFEWSELHLWDRLRSDDMQKGMVDFRIVESQEGIKRGNTENRVPYELVDTSISSAAFSEIMEGMKKTGNFQGFKKESETLR